MREASDSTKLIALIFVVGLAVAAFQVMSHKRQAEGGYARPTPAAAREKDDWTKGYDLGATMGRASALSGDSVPTEARLRNAAHEISANSYSIRDKDLFDRGFMSGFEAGYKKETKPAF